MGPFLAKDLASKKDIVRQRTEHPYIHHFHDIWMLGLLGVFCCLCLIVGPFTLPLGFLLYPS